VKRCLSVFDAQAASLDFGSPSAAREINHWVSEKTNGKIGDIVTQDSVARSKMVLTNAVYFSSKWQAPFQSSATERASFHKQGGGVKTVSMMYKSRLSGAYRSGSTFEGAMLYYGNSGVYFYALLPRSGRTPNDVLASLDPAHLNKGSQGIDLELKLPRFTVDYSSNLGSCLEKMGMAIAFRFPAADFSPIGSRKFVIGEVIHKTRLEVDENGTVAAAATAIGMRGGAAPGHREVPPLRTVVFNRPFVVLIGDSSTGALLFAGVIEEP
jgi:serine protease inhibitor